MLYNFRALLLLCVVCVLHGFTVRQQLIQQQPYRRQATEPRTLSMTATSSRGYGAWLPFGSISSLSHKEPNLIEVAGSHYAVWKSQLDSSYCPEKDVYEHAEDKLKGWSVVADACPHRLAPLSQGRIDEATGSIECPYHGWQFNTAGTCTSIPQLEEERVSVLQSPKTAVNSLPVYTTGDLIWAYVPLPGGLGDSNTYDSLPDELFPELKNANRSFFMRDLPYSFDFLIENFMDPAHIPFAHHSMQGVRSDGSPIPMKLLTEISNSTHCEVAYTDTIRNKTREGVVSFIAPCYYHFRVKNPATGEWNIHLMALVVPVAPGKSRIIMGFLNQPSMPKFIPTWLIHSFSNKFLNTDIWIHNQEQVVRRELNSFYDAPSSSSTTAADDIDSDIDINTDITASTEKARASDKDMFNSYIKSANRDTLQPILPRYALMSTSDKGCIAWRRWWDRHMSLSAVFGVPRAGREPPPMLSFQQKYDTFEQHAMYCKHCRTAVTNAEKIKTVAPFAGLLVLAVTARYHPLLRLTGPLVYIALHTVSKRVIRAVKGPSIGEVVSAAQIPEKKKKKKKKF